MFRIIDQFRIFGIGKHQSTTVHSKFFIPAVLQIRPEYILADVNTFAAAGKAAHLAGAMAAGTTLPVIGIPVKSSTLDGLDALLSTVQMPSGMPVATVAIDGAVNAALLAIQILAVSDEALAEKLAAYRKEASDKVLAKDQKISEQYSTK